MSLLRHTCDWSRMCMIWLRVSAQKCNLNIGGTRAVWKYNTAQLYCQDVLRLKPLLNRKLLQPPPSLLHAQTLMQQQREFERHWPYKYSLSWVHGLSICSWILLPELWNIYIYKANIIVWGSVARAKIANLYSANNCSTDRLCFCTFKKKSPRECRLCNYLSVGKLNWHWTFICID